jgi:hypothetical protein
MQRSTIQRIVSERKDGCVLPPNGLNGVANAVTLRDDLFGELCARIMQQLGALANWQLTS